MFVHAKKEQLWNVPNYDCWKQFFWQVNKEKVFKEEAPTTVRHLTALREWIICKILGGHNFWVILHFFACVIIFMQSAAAKMLNTYLICCHLIEFDVINCGASAIWHRIFFYLPSPSFSDEIEINVSSSYCWVPKVAICERNTFLWYLLPFRKVIIGPK